MDILVPLSDIDHIERFSVAGADEFYFGFRDECWDRKFGIYEEINRMSSFGSKANFIIDDIDSVIRKIHSYNKKAFLTLNSFKYSSQQLRYFDSIFKHFSSIDGVIISDAALIPKLREYGISVTMSTIAGCYNSLIVGYYKKAGADRIVLPRDIQLDDAEKIISVHKDLKYEMFIMRNGCKYSDSQCCAFHARKYGSMCSCIDNSRNNFYFTQNTDSDFIRETFSNNKLFTMAFHKNTCGICAVERMKKMNISSLKIVGRADDPLSVEKDIKIIRSLISEKSNKKDYYENCLYGLNCYYKK